MADITGRMTPAEHYREAEALAHRAAGEQDPEEMTALATLAQVHATLSLATNAAPAPNDIDDVAAQLRGTRPRPLRP